MVDVEVLVEPLADYLGTPVDELQARAHLHNVAMAVHAYTRGIGFSDTGTPSDEIEAVIISSAARSIQNPTHDRQRTVGPFTSSPGAFRGWTLAELAILNRYRKRAH